MSEGNNNITIGQLTETINNKMDRDGLNANTSWIFVVSKQDPTPENGYTWYRKYSDGWVEQGGIVSVLTGGAYAAQVVTLPIEMKNTSYTIMTSCTYPGTGDTTTTVKVDNSLTTTQNFSVRKNWQSTGGGFHWQVSGIAA